ncbi:hypothetical protein PZ938_03490 [Luteipulveratus sp. YIM 133132]|uniref:hypothetical protein n=1 Tax=Luteipulveratus flavus TaxID=3031728 RepID=UPI0023B1BDE8|nr:hypothetical protein [Luteipulveratus sp. YIM 133132]MDE9364657.1 hypothetical protein [Luteipulveratus sp. YIM 133132]
MATAAFTAAVLLTAASGTAQAGDAEVGAKASEQIVATADRSAETAGEVRDAEDRSDVSVSSSDGSVAMDGVTMRTDVEDTAAEQVSGSVVQTGSDDMAIVTREHEEGAQTMVVLQSPDSPRSVSFTFDQGATLRMARDLGVESDEVLVMQGSQVHSLIDSPWAVDANGNRVETYYSVTGNTLTQHLKPSAGTAYPVTMDPDWVGIAKCAGAIALAAGAIIVPGGLVAKLISKVGSLKKAAKIIYRTVKAKKYNDKVKALRTMAVELGASLTGIGLIADKCG